MEQDEQQQRAGEAVVPGARGAGQGRIRRADRAQQRHRIAVRGQRHEAGQALGDDVGCVPTIPVKIDGGRILISRKEALANAA